MATNQTATEQVESTFVGINQIIKAISTLKKKEEKEAEKADIKTNLERINPDFIKGSAIAPLYRRDTVKKALNLTLAQVDSIYDLANTRSASAIKNEIKKLEQQKKDINERIKTLTAELLK
jgi:chaperonin cofactor prefoldin